MPSRLLMLNVLRALIVSGIVVLCTVGGMALGLEAGSDQRHTTTAGTLDTKIVPSRSGHVSVFVPLVDWSVRLLELDAPVAMKIEVRSIDRAQASKGISSPGAASSTVRSLREQTTDVMRSSVRRALLVAAVGGMIGGLIAGAFIGAVLHRRHWLLVAPVIAAVVVTGTALPVLQDVRGLSSGQVRVTANGGNASEVASSLRFARQLLDVGDEYETHYATALQSITNLSDFASEPRPEPDETAYVISDLHNNAFVLGALDTFAGDDTVFAIGDFGQVGARVEQRIAPKVAALGGHVVAVSGNHDTREYMQSLAVAGATVLDADAPTTTALGMRVAGWPDPLERQPSANGAHRLRVYGSEYEQQAQDLLDWWDALPTRPDMVLVHQHGFAHRLIDHLKATGDDAQLVVLAGHDHVAHVHEDGPHVIIDPGTLGAGGIVAIGEQQASLAQLELIDGRITAVNLISIEPIAGTAQTKRIELDRK